MNILLIGSGGSNHSIANSLQESENIEKIYCLPGNDRTNNLNKCKNVKFPIHDFATILNIVNNNSIDLVVIGPEQPLALGIVDYLEKRGIKVFGPNKKAAQIESSKIFAKELMRICNIPTASSIVCSVKNQAKLIVKTMHYPLVLKKDGLTNGQRVIIALNYEDALEAIDTLFNKTILIEEYLEGEEFSLLVLSDGKTFRPLTYSPLSPIKVDKKTELEISNIITKTFKGLVSNFRIKYKGILSIKFMLTKKGPKVLDYNCRFGDPEAQFILPLLKTPLDLIFIACVNETLHTLQWEDIGLNDYMM